jgi:hypothetical protein
MYQAIEEAKQAGDHDATLARDALAKIASALETIPSAPLVVNPADQDVLLNRTGIRTDIPQSAKRLAAARKQLCEQLADDLDGRTMPNSRLARLQQWANFLRNHAYVVVLISSSPHKIGSHENPWQDVFEPDHGHIRFYGDNKSPNKAADASFGNRVLPQKFRAPRTRTTAGRRHRWSSFGE